MPTNVNKSGTWYEADQINVNDGGTWYEVDEAYANVSGTWEEVFSSFQATSFVTLSSGSGTFAVPDNANAIHIQYAVGGGGGAAGGADYDKAGGESAGAGGGSGAYVSDKIFSVTELETISYSIGSGGAAGNQTANFKQPRTASAGTNTTLSGSTTGSIFTLGAGGGSSGTGGGVQGPLRTNTAGTAGSATVSGTVVTSGTFKDSVGVTQNVTSNTSGPVGTFNQSGNGAAGGNGINYPGDNANGPGRVGASSFAGNIAGGAGGNAGNGGPYESGQVGKTGSRGSGGGGGGTEQGAPGGVGGSGQIIYRFLRVN